ncbi:CMRF35-like molecule 8 [Centroberyx affinis]|uniref:CMRF35-like molecule 8 n=1 Tax=Centroberyx affinis TaxID=166261 RepID=UPI003A5C353A
MNIHRIALCYVFLAVQCDVNTGLFSEDPRDREAKEGENITLACSFTSAGNSKKFFCKGECKNENILIETDKDKDQNGRYSIEDKRTGLFYVTITQLTKSDSGSYRCGVDRLLTRTYKEFNITVTDAPTGSIQALTVYPDTTTVITDTTDTTDTSASITGSSGSSTPSSPLSTKLPAAQVSGGFLVFVVCVTVVVVLLAVSLLLLYKWKTKRESDGSNTRGNSDSRNLESVTYENCAPASRSEPDSTYQSLSLATMDQDQTYSTLTQTRESNSKYFWKEENNNKKILIQTSRDREQNGRYRIEGTRTGVFFVTITQLTKSDSGSYRCGVDKYHSYQKINITVTDGGRDRRRVAVVVVVVVVVVLLAVSLLLLYKWKTNRECDGSNTRGNSDTRNPEIPTYENCPPASRSEPDSNYRSLSPATMDQDQTYSTLTQTR